MSMLSDSDEAKINTVCGDFQMIDRYNVIVYLQEKEESTISFKGEIIIYVLVFY